MQHGGDLTAAMARHGGGREDWLDLSTGINPHAYPLPRLDERSGPTCLRLRCSNASWMRPAPPMPCPGGGARGRAGHAGAHPVVAAPAAPGADRHRGTTYDEHGISWRRAGHPVLDLPADALERGFPEGAAIS